VFSIIRAKNEYKIGQLKIKKTTPRLTCVLYTIKLASFGRKLIGQTLHYPKPRPLMCLRDRFYESLRKVRNTEVSSSIDLRAAAVSRRVKRNIDFFVVIQIYTIFAKATSPFRLFSSQILSVLSCPSKRFSFFERRNRSDWRHHPTFWLLLVYMTYMIAKMEVSRRNFSFWSLMRKSQVYTYFPNDFLDPWTLKLGKIYHSFC
jgi:hypothetical protein